MARRTESMPRRRGDRSLGGEQAMTYANARVALGLTAAAALMILSTASAEARFIKPPIFNGTNPGTVLTPVPPPQPTPVPPFAVPSISIVERKGTSLKIKWCDRSGQDTKHALFRGTDPETADDVIAAQLSSPAGTGCHEHVHELLTPDTNYCFRIAPMQFNSVMIDYLSGTVCAYTREAQSRPVWRVEMVVRTGPATDDDTENTVVVRLNDRPPPVFSGLPDRQPSGNETYLDYGRDDFERGRTDTYDLNMTGISEFGDIHGITFGVTGSDTWCLSSFSLLVNGVRVYQESRSPCVKSQSMGTTGTPFFFVSHDKLRAHPLWKAYKTPQLIDLAEAAVKLQNGEPVDVLTIPRQELESRIEGAVGHAIAFNKLEWGELFGNRFVEASATFADPQLAHIDLDLEADVPLSNPEVDIDFDLRFSMNCVPELDRNKQPTGKFTGIDFGFTTENFVAYADDSILDQFLGIILCTIDAQCHPTLLSFVEKQIRAGFTPLSKTVSIQTDQAKLACDNGLLPTVVVTEEADVVLSVEPGAPTAPTPSPSPKPYGNIRDGFIRAPNGGLLFR
jgi:hypothetical protein